MTPIEHAEHLAQWQDRLQDALDTGVQSIDAIADAELQAHARECAVCRARFAELLELDRALCATLIAPQIDPAFDASLMARISEDERHRKAAARSRAEREFRRRLQAFQFDWRDFFRRNIGNLLGGLVVLATALMMLGPTLNGLFARVSASLSVAQSTAMPLAIGLGATLCAAAALWWLHSRSQ